MAAEPLGEIDRTLLRALGSIAFGNVRQRTVGVELRCVVAERDRERADGISIVHEAVELGALRARLLDRVADNDEASGRILRWSRDRPAFSARPLRRNTDRDREMVERAPMRPPVCPDRRTPMRFVASEPDKTDSRIQHVMFVCDCGRMSDQMTYEI